MKIGCEFLYKKMKSKNFSYELALMPSYLLVAFTTSLIYWFTPFFIGKFFIQTAMIVSIVLFIFLVLVRSLKSINNQLYKTILRKIQK